MVQKKYLIHTIKCLCFLKENSYFSRHTLLLRCNKIKAYNMQNELTPKIAMLSALYFLLAIVILILLDLGLTWFINHVVFVVLDKFNSFSTIVKILIAVLGGAAIFWSLLELTGRVTTLLGGLVFNKLPHNLFTLISSFIISIANSIWFIYQVWVIPESYSFWIVIELIMLSAFIWMLSAIVMPAKEQARNMREDRYR